MQQPGKRPLAAWTAVAVLLFTLALSVFVGSVWTGGFREVVVTSVDDDPQSPKGRWASLHRADLLYSVAMIARNARTFASDPARLFDPESCFPNPNSLTLGEPMLKLGLLAVPAFLVTGDPVASYNFATHLVIALGALAMYLVVTRWSGSPPAGIVAGLLYGFHHARLHNAIHPYVHDTLWIVLGLYFAREWFARGRWRDALGLALCGALQLLGSFYPVLTGAILAVPVGVWLLHARGWRGPPKLQLAVVALLLAATAAAVYAPHLSVDPDEDYIQLGTGAGRLVDAWRLLLPGAEYFPGWLPLLLLLPAFAIRRQPSSVDPVDPVDPRWPLLAAMLALAVIGSGGNPIAVRDGTAWFAFPDLWGWLSGLVPGMERVRRTAALFSGIHLCASLLAGFGVAALLRGLSGRAATAAALAAVALTFAYVARPIPLMHDQPVRYGVDRVAPPAELLAFFDALAAAGNRGPLLEVGPGEKDFERRAAALVLANYHRRPTSVCYGSFLPKAYREGLVLAGRLPAPEALAEARALGFTTILLHRPRGPRGEAFRRASQGPDAPLRRLAGIPVMAAYEIR